MDPMLVRRLALPFALIMFLILAVLLPILRVRRRTGQSALVFQRSADPFQRVMGFGFGLYEIGYSVWALLYGALGPAKLGLWRTPAAVEGLGWCLGAAGFVLVLAAQQQMGTSWRIGIDDRPTALVTHGIFGLSRNPVFTAMLVMLAGVTLISPSPWTIMGGLGTALLVNLQVRLEETHLLRVHGEEYRAYAARVGRFVPGLGLGVGASAAESAGPALRDGPLG